MAHKAHRKGALKELELDSRDKCRQIRNGRGRREKAKGILVGGKGGEDERLKDGRKGKRIAGVFYRHIPLRIH